LDRDLPFREHNVNTRLTECDIELKYVKRNGAIEKTTTSSATHHDPEQTHTSQPNKAKPE